AVVAVGSTLLGALINPITTIAIVLLYFDLRVRRKVSIWTNSPSRLPRALPRPSAPALRRAGPLITGFVVALLSVVPASASQADDYRNAVHRALTLVQFAERGDAPSVGQALQALDSAPGPGQPEILKDLRAEPPNLTDADQRLQALFTALQASV